MQFTFVFISELRLLEREAEEEQAEVMDSDESDMEDAMETNEADALTSETGGMDAGEGNPTQPKEVMQAKPRRVPPVVSSGLPQSKEELEALISSIHHTVTQSILPRLHKCLIAKVSVHCFVFFFVSVS